MENLLNSLSESQKEALKKRFPDQFAIFEGNPPISLADYLIGMTGGKYRLLECNEFGYCVVMPSENNREIVAMSSMNKDRCLSLHQQMVLHWLWARNEIIEAKAREATEPIPA